MAPSTPSGFWEQGPRTLVKELKKEESEAIANLELELQEAEEPVAKAGIKDKIKQLRREFRDRRRAIDSGLFIASPQGKSKGTTRH